MTIMFERKMQYRFASPAAALGLLTLIGLAATSGRLTTLLRRPR